MIEGRRVRRGAGEIHAKLRIADFVLDDIAETLGVITPEQGGALLGAPGMDWVTEFIHDADAGVTSARYRNTRWLMDEIERVERSSAARFKGIIHSHPLGMPVPSGQDRSEYATSLQLNETLCRYMAVIVTHDVTTPLGSHELVLGPARMSFYCAFLSERGVRQERAQPIVVPVGRSLTRAGIKMMNRPALVNVEGRPLIATTAALPGRDAGVILFGADYPATPPTIMCDGVQPALSWDLSVPETDRLAHALTEVPRTQVGVAIPLHARSTGLLSSRLSERRVLIVGAGSVGSYLAEAIVRSGVAALDLIDPDTVSPENLGRSLYRVADIGLSKVEALAQALVSINPDAKITTRAMELGSLTGPELSEMVCAADLVVAATDDLEAQSRLDHFAYWFGKPAIFPAMYARAEGGEVIITMPGTPCWGCTVGTVRRATETPETPSPHRRTDYETGRLEAEPGLLVDIHHVTSAAAKLALGLLHDQDDQEAVARFVAGLRERGTYYGALGNVPDYWLFPKILGSAIGQYAYQSVWFRADRDENCVVCGPQEQRTDPTENRQPKIDGAALLAMFEEEAP
ncbi:MAG: ThiF family adenylyltransferase [Streptosporangiaceae bacterium]